RDDLRRRDGETYTFVEGLIGEMEAALAGDAAALRSNRAQIYVNLAQSSRRGGTAGGIQEAAVLLDSALIHDPGYLPAMIEYASLEGERGRMARAQEWVAVAEGLDGGHTPLLVLRAELLGRDPSGVPGAAETRVELLRRASEQERDPQLRAGYVRELWELQEALGSLPDAIATAEAYALAGPESSSRLRQ